MALSQLQCLDENHVNPRVHEAKPEFLYCEDQRLALETLLRDGREAFFKHLEDCGLRGFLSDPELETLAGSVEPYDPGSELQTQNGVDSEPPLSLHYWPELSDTSIPQMDLGWPDACAYRGVTRCTVYTQPPLDGHAHIKEIVRKMIAQAQKVIAVVMDVFTDVDIFRDLLDASFKRRVSVYILLERTALPHFLSMCQRANMHVGHLKHLRVRCTEGLTFHTRSSTKVRGRMENRFMFVDGDKAVSGSYSFTWMASRLDKNLVTMMTGQAVDTFDRLFRTLYVTSTSVDLHPVATDPEPEPEPIPQPAVVVPPSAEVARKLYNPKYALLLGSSSPGPSDDQNNPKNASKEENPGEPEAADGKKSRRVKEDAQEAPHIHPGLVDLEKACLISYLPTWPEPDPPSDVIGFINVRDSRKPTQVHLQRSEMFETSQAIRFSSPFAKPKEALPEVAKPRQLSVKPEKKNKHEPMVKNSQQEMKHAAQSVPVNKPELDSLPGAKSGKEETTTNKQSRAGKSTQNSSEIPPNVQPPAVNGCVSPSSTSKNNQTSTTTNPTTSSCAPVPSTSAPSLTTAAPPVPKPRTVQLLIKDGSTSDGLKLQEVSMVKRTTTNTESSEPAAATGMQKSTEQESKTVPELQNHSGKATEAQKDSENTGNAGKAPEHKQTQETKMKEVQPDIASTQEAKTQRLITDAPKEETLVTEEVDAQPQRSTSVDCKLMSRTDSEAADVPNDSCQNLTQTQLSTCAHKFQCIYYTLTTHDIDVLGKAEDLIHTPAVSSDDPHESRDAAFNNTSSKHEQRGNQSLTAAPRTDPGPYTAKHSTSNVSREVVPVSRGGTHTIEKPLHLLLSDTHVAELRSRTPERSVGSPVRTPTPDVFFSRTPTPDSRMYTPDSQPCTPDFRTPTSDLSDGYATPRRNSALSTASDEFYECSDSPFHETTSPSYMSHSSHAAAFAAGDGNSVKGERSSEPAGKSDSFSLAEKMKVWDGKDATKKVNGRQEGDGGKKVMETRTQKRAADCLKQQQDLTNKKLQPEAPKNKREPNQMEAKRVVDAGVRAGDVTSDGADPKQVSTTEHKTKTVSSKGEKPDKETAVDRVTSGPGGGKRSRPRSTTDTEKNPLRLPRGRQQDNRGLSLSRQNRSRSLADKSSSPHRPPPVRPSPPGVRGAVGSSALQKWSEVSDRIQSLFSGRPSATGTSPQLKAPQNQTTSAQEEDKSPFNFSIARLYSLTSQDKMSKLPAQSKKGHASSPAQGHMSTS
ncbi:uncharacterized protein V6R79_024155 [Siganus canaliculatus]